VLHAGPVTLRPEGVQIELQSLLAAAGDPEEGLITVEMTALEPAVLTGGAYSAALPAHAAQTPLALAISITTFRREADVARTVARICGFLEGEGGAMLAGMGARAHLFVVDNGQSVSLPAHPHLTLIPNANLGGAGGFARGLAAAEDGGFSHCLFMDDDASFQMESLVRTLAFLRLARSPRAAVAGAMISAGRPWAMWENGAVFDRSCRPQFLGTDLRDPDEVAAMELAASAPKPPGFYGGWWYFAFPLAHVRHYPFPFFVRGDDISFSLAHDFDTVTLPGVVSFQEDFAAKESPQTLYLDLRNHLHHHLVHPKLDIGAWRTARIALWFIARSLVRMHYDSAEAQLLSWADVMQGPGFFAANADMTAKRPQVAALIRTEAWTPLTDPGPEAAPYGEPGPLVTRLCKLTLNGHLVPGWRLLAGTRVIEITERGLLWPLWGAARATYVDRAGGRSYTVRHDKRRFLTIGGRTLRLLWRWNRLYPGLKRAYRASYGDLAGRGFWEQRFLPGSLPTPVTGAPRAAE
jgi:galactofuranosylgalactofuranosylrhamnosyl-N-acetylglucosaminyl-diphospho-decaprenol beta-1,5/1,6-galactofuranosyltransferase